MQKLFLSLGLMFVSLTGARASTLLQLSLNDMILQSTSIVRGKVQLAYVSQKGSVIYTHYQVQVSATFKGAPTPTLDLAVLGGVSNGVRQIFAGAPTFTNGQDYVLFLWTSKSGITQVIGLSQGLFKVVPAPSGQSVVMRAAATEPLLNASGQPVTDSDFQMSLSSLESRIQSVLSGASQ
jgi:hypothetical protein